MHYPKWTLLFLAYAIIFNMSFFSFLWLNTPPSHPNSPLFEVLIPMPGLLADEAATLT